MNGTMYAYYFICKRKLWLFSNQVSYEAYDENVKIGKAIDETYYNREQKGYRIDSDNQIDFIDKYNVLHEVKKSDSHESAHVAQAKYYAYKIVKSGGKILGIEINYPELNKVNRFDFTDEDYQMVESTIIEIEQIIGLSSIPN